MNPADQKCLQCGRSALEIPLIPLHYQEQTLFICPQHLPILIHKPEQLADQLPGARNLRPPEEHS